MSVDKKVREEINWFIYAYETFDEGEIASNLTHISTRDIREVLKVDFIEEE